MGSMTAPALRRDVPASRYRRVPWSPGAWRQALYLVGGVPAQIVALFVVLVPIFANHHRWPFSLLALAVVFIALPVLTRVQRQRLRATAGVAIPPRPAIPNRLSLPGIAAAARSRATWQQAGYHLLAGPAAGRGGHRGVRNVAGGCPYMLAYAYVWTEPPGSLLRNGESSPPHILRLLYVPLDVYLMLGGIPRSCSPPRG